MKVEYIQWPLVKNSNLQALHIREVFDQVRPILSDTTWGFPVPFKYDSDTDQATTASFHIFSSNFHETFYHSKLHKCKLLTNWLSKYLDGRYRFLIRYLVLSDTRNSPHFIVPEGSFPCSESLASCLYPRPDKSSPCRTIPPLFSHVDKYFQTFSFPQVSLSINVCAFLFFIHATFSSLAVLLELVTSAVCV